MEGFLSSPSQGPLHFFQKGVNYFVVDGKKCGKAGLHINQLIKFDETFSEFNIFQFNLIVATVANILIET